jgi:hypothetical protein
MIALQGEVKAPSWKIVAIRFGVCYVPRPDQQPAARFNSRGLKQGKESQMRNRYCARAAALPSNASGHHGHSQMACPRREP